MKTHILGLNSKINYKNSESSLQIYIFNSDHTILKQFNIISHGFNLVRDIHDLIIKEYKIDSDNYYIVNSDKKLTNNSLTSKNADIIFINQYLKINESSKLIFYPKSINVKLRVNKKTINQSNSNIEFSSIDFNLDTNVILKEVLNSIEDNISFISKENTKLCFEIDGNRIDDEYTSYLHKFNNGISIELSTTNIGRIIDFDEKINIKVRIPLISKELDLSPKKTTTIEELISTLLKNNRLDLPTFDNNGRKISYSLKNISSNIVYRNTKSLLEENIKDSYILELKA